MHSLPQDQRQVCTGRNLRDGIISDDCETSASAIKAEHKTLMLIKAYMIREGFFPSDRVDDAEFLSETNHPDYMESIKACCDFLAPPSRFIQDPQQVKTDGIETGREVEYYSFEVKNKQKEGNVEIVLALANILRQFEFKLNLCMGTANGAQVGEEKKVCGHCYLILDAHYIKDGLDIRCMVEGTNWVTQHKSIDSPMKLSLAEYQMLNEVSALLMEATKLKSHNPKDDKGKGLVTMLEVCSRTHTHTHIQLHGSLPGRAARLTTVLSRTGRTFTCTCTCMGTPSTCSFRRTGTRSFPTGFQCGTSSPE